MPRTPAQPSSPGPIARAVLLGVVLLVGCGTRGGRPYRLPVRPEPSAGSETFPIDRSSPAGTVAVLVVRRTHDGRQDYRDEDLPVAGARVTLTSEHGVVREGDTDEEGRVTFAGVPPGSWEVFAHRDFAVGVGVWGVTFLTLDGTTARRGTLLVVEECD